MDRNLPAGILHIFLNAALFDAKGNDGAQIILGTRILARMIGSRISLIVPMSGSFAGLSTMRIVVLGDDFIDYSRRGRDQVDVVFSFQSLLHDFHMQHAQKTAAEAEA